ncbi:MAG: hypothetical protein LBD46_06130 [Endomicrobium sp.]|jgi:Ser-tRNA(Ala) deacylase AlaX|nr:hypothetical protein [Endomicrobium sp.]
MSNKADLNQRIKEDDGPMHTTEHILNQTMVRVFGCGRCFSAHIERKKSKCDYRMEKSPSDVEMAEVEKRVNEIISKNMTVTAEIISRQKACELFDLSRLPQEAGETLRIVKVGNYDVCPCIGRHVSNTSEIAQRGKFKIISYDHNGNVLRVRFKLQN